MTTELELHGRMARATGRAPMRYSTGRICATTSCSTNLSTYNERDMCFRHTPIRFPLSRTRRPTKR